MMWNIFSDACFPSAYLFLVTYLLRSLVHFLMSFFFLSFLLWGFKVSFSPSSVCLLQIFFSQSVTLSFAKEKF